MYPYTTPTHYYRLPIEAEYLDVIRVSYSQIRKDNVILVKEKEDMELNGLSASCELTQEETALFIPGKKVYVQLHAKTEQGVVLQSSIVEFEMNEAIDNEVI